MVEPKQIQHDGQSPQKEFLNMMIVEKFVTPCPGCLTDCFKNHLKIRISVCVSLRNQDARISFPGEITAKQLSSFVIRSDPTQCYQVASWPTQLKENSMGPVLPAVLPV